jgi:hypothetical protein
MRAMLPARLIVAAALAGFSPLMAAQASAPITQVWMNADFIDPLVNNQYQYYSPPNSTITVQKHSTDDGVRVVASGRSPWLPFSEASWQLDFSPVAGQSFATGFYENAEKYPFNLPGHPGMDISSASKQCGRLIGNFTVLEIERDSSGEIVKLAIDFQQRCEFFAEIGLYGNVRFNANTPWDIPYIALPPLASMQLYDDPGEPLGIVQTGFASARWGRVTTGNVVRFGDEIGPAWGVPPLDEVSFQAPGGVPLTVGVYENARKIGSNTGAGIDFQYSNMTCDEFTGRFVVHESDLDPYGYVRKFAADFELHCDGASPALYGAVRYNSDLPYFDPRTVRIPTPPPPVVTTAVGRSPTGAPISLSVSGAVPSCSLLGETSFVDITASESAVSLPANVAVPYGAVSFRTANCGAAGSVDFTVQYPDALPPTAQWWMFGPTADNANAHWYAIPSSIEGNKIRFTITDGGLGDRDLTINNSIGDAVRELGLLAIPGGAYQDLWWSGLAENGWGMSIVQHRDVLFANVFAYDSQGAPTWYVMPSGSWNDAHTSYSGNLYLPKGSPFYAYDAAKFDIGAPVGTATFTFADVNSASFDYTVNGITGHKNITRLHFGPQDAPTDKPLGDLWWAGSQQNGWGIALMQQYSSLFGLWFTYDADGKPTWFVMPAGSWVMKDDYQGKIYKADGPPWIGVTYDPSRYHITEVGTFRFRFSGDVATFDFSADGKSGSIPLTRIPF